MSNPENSATRSAIQQQLLLAFMTLEAIKLTVGDPDTEGPWMWGADVCDLIKQPLWAKQGEVIRAGASQRELPVLAAR